MKFLYPEFLWALTVLAIPIVIHLFNFKRYKTLYFSSLNFIKQVDQKTRSTQRLKHILVLISRMLAFTFLVLAFAQPIFPEDDAAKEGKTNLMVFYLDNSFSMQAQGAEGELLSQARENARDIINKAPIDAQFIIGTNDMTGIEEHVLTKAEALEKLDKIQLSPLFRSSAEILKWQSQLIDNTTADAASNVQYVYFSDFQKSSGFGKEQVDGNKFRFYPIKLSPERNTNVYIDSVWFSSPVHKAGEANEINIEIVNTHPTALENVEVDVQIGEYNKTMYVSLPATDKTVTQLTYNEKSTGLKKASIKVTDDFVHFDDVFYLSYEVRKNSNVLILNGEDAVSNVAVVYNLESYYIETVSEITSVTLDDFNEKDLIVVNGANTLSTGIANYIIEFIQGGGSVALFPGTAPDANNWNYLLERIKLPRIGQEVSSGNKIKKLNYDDPFFNGVFEKTSDQLNLPSVAKTFLPVRATNSIAIDLITLQNGLPLFTQGKLNGNAFMFYSSLSESFGSITKDALFSTLLLRMGELSQRSQPNYLTIGKDSRYPVFEKMDDENNIHIIGNNLDFIPQHTSISGVTYLSVNLMSEQDQLIAGNYTIQLSKPIGTLSLNYNRQESDLDAYTEEEIKANLNSLGIKDVKYAEIGADSTLSTVDIDKPFGYWKICIIITLIFVLIEMALIRFLK